METTEKPFLGGRKVRCKDCGKEYICTPENDYYHYTNNKDGVCEQCLLQEHGLKDAPVITIN